MKVKNLNGSGKQFPKPVCKCKTWIEHWNVNRYPKKDKKAGFCRGCNKKTSDLVGGHIIKIGTEDRCRYIVPLCSSCNNTENLEFEVKESDLVSANCENCCNN